MHRKRSLKLAALVVLAVLALIAATRFLSHASAGRPGVTVAIRDFKFEPATVTVHVGENVQWKNEDFVPHTATADGEAQKPAFDSGTINTGAAWRYVASKKGTYNYTCTRHPNMKGKLIVQ
ncbi:MAG: cupredoxin family copper-binding protein [Verrucomicrobia bacterium]|nr:cupredoxin family copper-binding protein [Verrucomicrobiota bacterium]